MRGRVNGHRASKKATRRASATPPTQPKAILSLRGGIHFHLTNSVLFVPTDTCSRRRVVVSFNKCETLAYKGLPGVLSLTYIRHHMPRYAPLFSSTATAICSAAATTGVFYPWPAWSRRVPRARHGTRGDGEVVPGPGHLQGPQAVEEPRDKEPGQEVRWGTLPLPLFFLGVEVLGCSGPIHGAGQPWGPRLRGSRGGCM